MTLIPDPSHGEVEEALAADPIIQDMAKGLYGHPYNELAHEGGAPRHEFMGAANDEYRKRGGLIEGHMGAVGRALLLVLKQQGQG